MEMEKVTETVTESAAAEAASTDAGAGSAQENGAAGGSGNGQEAGVEKAKMYDQAYIDRILADQKAAQEAAVAEALKVAGMDAGSKAAWEKEQAEKKLAAREADIALRELKADAREVLAKKDVPAEFLDLLVGKDLEQTKANADAFKRQFDAAVQAQVEKRLAGKTPSGGNGAGMPGEAETMAAQIDRYMD